MTLCISTSQNPNRTAGAPGRNGPGTAPSRPTCAFARIPKVRHLRPDPRLLESEKACLARDRSQGPEGKISDQDLLIADLAGHLEYDWDQQDLNPAGHARTPRDAGVEDITERLNSLSPTGHEAHCMNKFSCCIYTEPRHSFCFFHSRVSASVQYLTGLLFARLCFLSETLTHCKVEAAEEYAYAGGATEATKSKKGKSKHKEKEKSHRRHVSSDGKSSTTSHDAAVYTESAGLQCMLHMKAVIPVSCLPEQTLSLRTGRTTNNRTRPV